MKKVLIIVGSARQGNSLFAAKRAKKNIAMSGKANCEILQLSKSNIGYCDGCLHCDTAGVCHKKDDMSDIIEKVKSADGIIFSSPTRWSLLSGDIKVFMDRLNPMAGKGLFDNKKSFLIAVGQTNCTDSTSITNALESLRIFSDDAGFQFIDSYLFENCLYPMDIKTADMRSFDGKINAYLEKL